MQDPKRPAPITREQIEFYAYWILCAALDRVESQLPDCVPLDEYRKHEATIKAYACGAQDSAAMALAILFAQTTGDGCGTYDWQGATEFGDMVKQLVSERTNPDWPGLKPGDTCHPDPLLIAQAFADSWVEFMRSVNPAPQTTID